MIPGSITGSSAECLCYQEAWIMPLTRGEGNNEKNLFKELRTRPREPFFFFFSFFEGGTTEPNEIWPSGMDRVEVCVL